MKLNTQEKKFPNKDFSIVAPWSWTNKKRQTIEGKGCEFDWDDQHDRVVD
jgi:hypothetical protein